MILRHTKNVLFLLLLCFGVGASTFAQKAGNFYQLRDSMQVYYEANNLLETKEYKQFKRWEWMMSSRVAPDGDMSGLSTYWDVAAKYKQKIVPDLAKANPDWEFLGPENVSTFARLAGRANCIEFNPINPNIIWVGTPNGGLWKTTDGGATWSTPSDLLPNMGVTAIQIDYNNPNTMYCATGDGFGYSIGSDHWGGNYSNGVMVSHDGGASWEETGLNWDLTETKQVFRLEMHPNDPLTLFATSSNGLWKTSDGGVTWTESGPNAFGSFYDLKFHATDPNTMFVSTDGSGLHRTTDGGATWSQMSSPSSGNRQHFAVSPAEPSSLWMLVESSLYKSTNAGVTWLFIQTLSDTDPYLQAGGWYYGIINVSPVDPDIIYFAGLEHGRSDDGGVTWTKISDFMSDFLNAVTPHVDSRAIEFHPTDPNTIFVATDGGIFKSSNQGNTWQDLNEGIQNMQLYRMGNDQSDPNYLYVGAQDQGHYRLKNGHWIITDILGDGMESAIDPTNGDIVYAMTQNGYLYRSLDGGETFTDPFTSLGYGNWVTPMVFDPNNNDLYVGTNGLYKLAANSSSWEYITQSTAGSYPASIVISPQSSDHIYYHTSSKYLGGNPEVMSSHDNGVTWESTVDLMTGMPTLSSGLPPNLVSYTGIEVSHNDPNRVWLTIAGFVDGQKVYESLDGGLSWHNISGGLPNIPVNCIERENSANNGIYIGTDLGVFYRDDSMSDWVPFMTGLPNNIVLELEVMETSEEIRACTYGRGLWKSPLNSSNNGGTPGEPENTDGFSLYPNPSNGQMLMKYPADAYTEGVTVRVYNTLGQFVKLFRVQQELGSINLVFNDLSAGQYYFQVLHNDEVVHREIITIAQ